MLDARGLDEAITEYAGQIARMRACLSRSGRICSDRETALAWASYSDSLCASWLLPPDDDDTLTNALLKYLARSSFDDAVVHHSGPDASHSDTRD